MDPMNLVIVGIVALGVIFGAKKIPEMARSVGRAQGEFKKGLKEGNAADDEASPAAGETKAEAPSAEAPKDPESD